MTMLVTAIVTDDGGAKMNRYLPSYFSSVLYFCLYIVSNLYDGLRYIRAFLFLKRYLILHFDHESRGDISSSL